MHNYDSLRVLKLLEIGAGGEHAGKHAGEFTRRVGSSSELRRVLLCYANRRPIRAGREQFKSLAAVASDMDWNPENDYRFDVHSMPVRVRSIHVVVAVGPKGYGFWRERTTEPFLSEVARILVPNGELLLIGRFVNPWFNAELGSANGRRYIRDAAKKNGLRVANLLTPLGRHPISRVFRIPGNRFILRASDGRKLGEPCYFHRFVKHANALRGRRQRKRTVPA